jgi:hypothetical protein
MATLVPHVPITEAMYRKTGVCDYGDAIRAMRLDGPLASARVVSSSGMWGGYLAVRRARAFMLSRILSAPGVARHASELDRDCELATVAVHIRRSDFEGAPPTPGEFNRPLPLDWYRAAIDQLLTRASIPLRVLVVSDAQQSDLTPVLRDPRVHFVASTPLNDLYTLMSSDLVVPSVSSFSMAALWLGNASYLWYRDQLTDVDGWLSIWGAEPAQKQSGSPTLASTQLAAEGGRAIPFDGAYLDEAVLEHMEMASQRRRRERDLIYYGALRPASGEASA